MGGRGSGGSGSGRSVDRGSMANRIDLNTKINNGEYNNNGYRPYADGQITKFEAGVIYRNIKEGNIEALPETTSYIYQLKDLPMGTLYIRRADNSESYKDSQFFQKVTSALMSKDYKTANAAIKEWEKETIRLSGKKSPFAKYK